MAKQKHTIDNDYFLISKGAQHELAVFFAHYPPKVFNRHLRNVILDYLASHPDDAQFDFDEAVTSIVKLMRVMDVVEDEWVERKPEDVVRLGYPN